MSGGGTDTGEGAAPSAAAGRASSAPWRFGASGWSYKDWRGLVYDESSPSTSWLRQYALKYPTVEIDSTFYGTPRATTVRKWAEAVPDGFVFAAKVPQEITHERGLEQCRDLTHRFVDTMRELGDRLGPLLLQFGYGFRADRFDVLAAFLDELPTDVRFAVEVRHRSWIGGRFTDLLRSHGVALALIDHPWMPVLDTITTDFTYIRWLGDRKAVDAPFTSIRIDRMEALRTWAALLRRVATGLVTYGYFNNHYEGFSLESLARFHRVLEEGEGGAAA